MTFTGRNGGFCAVYLLFFKKVSVLVWAAITRFFRLLCLNNRNLVLTIPETDKSKVTMAADVESGERPLPVVEGREGASSFLMFIKALIDPIHDGSTLMVPSPSKKGSTY